MHHWMLLLLFVSSSLFAQVIEAPLTAISYDQNPSDMEWRHIETQHFDIIFPEEVEKDAQRVAHLLEKAYPFVTRSLEVLPPKIPLILQNQSTQSNGFVTLAPRRSEWYMTPAMEPMLGNTEWLKTLSLHEFRHVVQFEKSKQGFNKYFYYLLGEVGQALGLGFTLPPWYLEGDAVGIETALSKGGRGRLPLFDRDLRTLLLSGKEWNYDKAHLGSYEDYIPNHYYYGYFYTSYLRNMYGDMFLSRLANHAAESSYNPLTFYNTVDRDTGKSFESFYEHVMKDLILEWKKRADALTPTPYEVKNLKHRFGWTNYYYPQETEDGEIVVLKKGLSYIDRFVALKGKEERTLFYPGPLMNEYPYKLRGNKLAFLEAELDPRWGYRDYARLKIYDLKQDKFVVDKRKTKWRLAVLDHQGIRTLVVEWDENQQQYILALDKKGKEILRIPHMSEEVITSLDWINDNEIVMVTRDHDDLKALVKLNLVTREKTDLVPKGINNLGYVAVEEGNIFYESPESGIDNIWLFTKSGPRQITSALFGAYAPTLKDNKLIYNDYTVKGMNVVSKTLPWAEEQKSQDSFYPVYEKFAKAEKPDDLYASYFDKEKFESAPYSQPRHALNVHSWVLLAPPLGASVIAEAYSRDVLNKFSLGAGASYNLNEQAVMGFASATWMHYYPVFDIRAAYGGRKEEITRNGQKIDDRWEEGTFEAGVSVPWQYIQGRFFHSFTARAFAKLIKVTNKNDPDPSEVTDGALYSPGGHISYSVVSRMARRDINPSLGLVINGHAEDGRDITGNGMRGSLRSVDSRLYLPGLWHHHSFYHQFAYEKQDNRQYEYASYIFYPRGTRYGFLKEFTKYSGNYTMPLFYPDYNLSRYMYFKRIALNLFYDELNSTRGYRASSYGWESIFEFSVLRLMFPISIGVRGSYVLEGAEKDSNYELFLASVLGTF